MHSIKKEITNGVFWIAVAKYSGIFISLGITAILARSVSPSAFGTMAIATVIIAFLDIFTDMGIGPAIIQFKQLTGKQLDSLFVISGLLGLILSTGLFLSSSPIAKYYEDPILVNIIRILCICLLFNSLNIVPNGLMLRNRRFKTIAIRTLSFQIICGVIAAFGALNGWGIYALIITPVLTSIGVFFVNFYNYPQKIRTSLDLNAVKLIFSYSSFQFLFSFINYFSRNLDKLIIGKNFSMTQLGYYEKSYRLMQLPLQNITYVISPVLHPILSNLQDNKYELGVKNVRLITILSRVSFPIGLFLYICAPEIIFLIFGSNWQQSIPIFQILSVSLPLQMLLSTSGAFYQAAGKTGHMFTIGLSNTLFTIIGFLFAAKVYRTLEAMAWAWDITLTLNFITSYTFMNRLTLKFPIRKFFTALWPQILNTCIVIIVAQHALRWITWNNILIEIIYKAFAVGIPTIIMALILRQYNFLHILKNLIISNKNNT